MAGPLTIKLRCASWGQLEQIYSRDLIRSAIFLKTRKPPPMATKVRINLTLPSETLIILTGEVHEHVDAGGLGGRGPGVDIALTAIPQSAMWLIESALASARTREASTVRRMPAASAAQATRQRRAPTHSALNSGTLPAPTEARLEDHQNVVAAEDDLVSALRTEFQSLRKLNPFQLLGVSYQTTDQEVRSCFASLTKKYHPDRYARYQSADARELASEIFILIRDAYRRIGNPRGREQSLRLLGRSAPANAAPPAPSAAKNVNHTPPAAPRTPSTRPTSAKPNVPLSGADLFESQTSPVAPVSAPLDLSGPAPINSELDRADQLAASGRFMDALKLFSATARRTPGQLRARAGVELCEGLKSLSEGDRLEAAQRFEMVLELDPENERAASELADMRRQATQDRKGLLARLLGKKE